MIEMQITLQAARVNAGLKANEAAELLGIGRTLLWQFEKGEKVPKLDIVHKMCELYNVPYKSLKY